MSGMIGVLSQDTGRYSIFSHCLMSIQAPAGSTIEWVMGLDIPANHNKLVRAALATNAEWLWIKGDDSVFAPDILTRLLSHDVDVVVPLCLRRMPPYDPAAFLEPREEGKFRSQLDLDEFPDGGLIEIRAAGTGSMLIRRHVLEAMEDPWFEYGQQDATEIGEDVYFCDKLREHGFELWCDLDTPLGHCTTGTVWPIRGGDGWTYGFTMAGGLQITMPREVVAA